MLQSAISQQLYAQAAARSWTIARAFAQLQARYTSREARSVNAGNGEAPTTIQDSPSGAPCDGNPDPMELPGSVWRFLACYFRRLSEIYAVYFVLRRHAMSVPPKIRMPPHAVLRACAFLWSHALAPLAEPLSEAHLTSFFGSAPSALPGGSTPELKALRPDSVTGNKPCWRLLPWWHDAQAAMELPQVQKCLGLCGIRLSRRPRGVRASVVLPLMAEAALQLGDLEVW